MRVPTTHLPSDYATQIKSNGFDFWDGSHLIITIKANAPYDLMHTQNDRHLEGGPGKTNAAAHHGMSN